ncbi:glycosyltransferase family 2 protein [Luteococcus sp. Sow4_B9]|uniref:glycosyltransferase family 2 protein n=1 Tax=Luteococcus sp. Sow4_B9 TaxID=3438792 RepID=UPI003F95569E
MKIGVVVPTVDRADALMRVLDALKGQTLEPEAVVVSPPDRTKLPAEVLTDDFVTVVDGVRGASAQRNLALAALPDGLDLVAFFDDDAVPRVDYLEKMSLVFEDASVIGATGEVVRDGAQEKRELSPAEMTAALNASRTRPTAGVSTVTGLYGCNMVVRAEPAQRVGFDERLALYSWLEDLDFSRQLLREGRLVQVPQAVCVHQGSASGGRKQHRRLGYSQVSNVVHLRRKGSITVRDEIRLIGRPVLASLLGSVRGGEKPERRERLAGMAMATGDVLRGRVTPERIESL